MTYKTIVTVLAGSWRAQQVDLSLVIARAMDAHLIGLWAARPMTVPSPVIAEAGPTVNQLIASMRAEFARREQAARTQFEAAASGCGHSKVEWRAAKGDVLTAACFSARYSDLAIAGQPEPGQDDTGHEEALHNALALSAGRPVLHVPYAGRFPSCGTKVIVAWNASREAARAVADSLPFLKRAQSVMVLVVDDDVAHGEMSGADLGVILARHDVAVEVHVRPGKSLGVGEVILNAAADESADLIVMGAYGHSRLRELVLGGATRTLLESMTVPVLMSH